MKKLATLLVTLLISFSSFAQTGINYKAVIKDALGNVVANDIINVKFSIIENTSSTVVYAEDHTNVMTDANGIVILNIGEGLPTTNTFASIAWGSASHSLKTEIDIEQDASFVNMGTTPFKTVPYALNVTGLEKITEGSNTGWRLKDRDTNSYGIIGGNAVDLSISDISSTNGATGNGSFAANYRTSAQGASSSALGNSTIATGDNSLAIGQFNKVDSNGLFIIGNGIDNVERNNALSLFKNGNFVVGSYQLNNNPSIETDDSRLFFNKSKGAFRAGFANGTQWDDSQIGDYSTAFGFVTTASGARSTALGSGTKASGFASTAIGNYNTEVLDAYFIVGNGTGDTNRKNAIVVKSNGDFIVGSSQLNDVNTTLDDNSRLFFNKAKSAFRAGGVENDAWDDIKVGSYSAAFGQGTIATGTHSTVIGAFNVENSNARFLIGNGIDDGNRNNALSLFYDNSFVVGSYQLNNNPIIATDDTRFFFNKSKGAFRAGFANGTQWDDSQIGEYSTAFGFVTTASGARSTAFGSGTKASGFATTAIGSYNSEVSNAYFIVGNGTDNISRSNALIVLDNGTITAPSLTNTLINTAGNKALVTKEYVDGISSTGLEKIFEGGFAGWRLIGRDPAQYNDVGHESIDFSAVDILSPPDLPNYGGATFQYATAFGVNTKAAGLASLATGRGTLAESSYSSVFGLFNVGGGDPFSSIATDPLFEIGNGSSNILRKNAFTVLKNGKVGIGRATPTSLLEVAHLDGAPSFSNRTNAFSIRNIGNGRSWQFYSHSTGYLELYNDGAHKGSFNPSSGVYATVSDRRLKKDITPLDNGTLQKVLQLNPVSYYMKDQTDTNINLGLISQEVQELFPSITHYSKEQDILSLSYTELIPVLIKALQEQQTIIENQNSKMSTFESSLTELSQRMKSLEASITQ